MKTVKVSTVSFVERVPKRKSEYFGDMITAREKAEYRARKYKGSSTIYHVPSGMILDRYSYDPDTDSVRCIHGA